MSDEAAASPGGGLQILVIREWHSLHAAGLMAGGRRGQVKPLPPIYERRRK
jgi:hypothetical protein